MSDEIDTEENYVPEPNAANSDGGAEKLNPDPITPDLDAHIDTLLDEADAGVDASPSIETNTEVSTGIREALQGNDQPQVPQIPQPQFQQPQIPLDPEIAGIEQPRNLSEKNQSNWRKLQETASIYKQQAAEAEILRQRLAQAEQNRTLPEDYEELRKFRQIFDVKNDPEFKSKFEAPISSAEDTIYRIMKQNGASDNVIESIKAAGGPDKIDQNWWQHNAISKLPFIDAEKLKKNLIDVVDLKQKQEEEIAYAAENAEQFIAERENKQKNWYVQETTNINNYVENLTKNVPWARYQQPTATTTPEEWQKMQAHNSAVQALEQKFSSALWPKNANDRAAVAAAATFSHVLTEQVRIEQRMRAQHEAQIKQLSAELSKLKGLSKVPRQNVTSSSPKQSSVYDRIKMSSSDAIDIGLDEAGA
jgi:hypothetical protein